MSETASRLARLRAALAGQGLDGFVATGLANVRYLSGYTGSNGLVAVTAAEARFDTDFRYADAVEPLRESWTVEIVEQDLVAALAGRLDRVFASGARVGFEAHLMPYASWRALDEAAQRAGVALEPTVRLVEGLRAVKSPDELERLRLASAIGDQVYEWLADAGLAGRSEREVARAVVQRVADLGADDASFSPVVAAAENGARPHGVPRDVEIPAGTLVVLDFGAAVDGYHGDCTRTFATGPTGPDEHRVYEVVLQAQQAALDLVRPGADCDAVHEAARRVIGEAGYGEFFNHGTGHGVGLEIHEEPRLRSGWGGVLEPGNVVTVEPGVYLPGRFGVRIEDLVVVTDDGHESLTRFPRSLLDVG